MALFIKLYFCQTRQFIFNFFFMPGNKMTFNLACPQRGKSWICDQNKALYLALIVSVCGVESAKHTDSFTAHSYFLYGIFSGDICGANHSLVLCTIQISPVSLKVQLIWDAFPWDLWLIKCMFPLDTAGFNAHANHLDLCLYIQNKAGLCTAGVIWSMISIFADFYISWEMEVANGAAYFDLQNSTWHHTYAVHSLYCQWFRAAALCFIN